MQDQTPSDVFEVRLDTWWPNLGLGVAVLLVALGPLMWFGPRKSAVAGICTTLVCLVAVAVAAHFRKHRPVLLTLTPDELVWSKKRIPFEHIESAEVEVLRRAPHIALYLTADGRREHTGLGSVAFNAMAMSDCDLLINAQFFDLNTPEIVDEIMRRVEARQE